MKRFYFFLVMGLLCLGNTVNLKAQSSRLTDSLALVDFYHSTNGPNWDSVAVWDLTEPLDSFYGVYLNENGCVDSLILDRNKLSGELPDLILPHITYLNLEENNLGDTLFDFSGMPNLLTLDLDGNDFTNLPDFSNVPKLQYLSLRSNRLKGNIPNFSNLRNVLTLRLAYNRLEGELPDFANMDSLRYLYVRDNRLEGAIPNFDLPNLAWFWAHSNYFTSIPDFVNTPNLQELLVQNNLLDSFPNLTNKPCLRHVRVCDNQLTFDDILPNFGKTSLACFSGDIEVEYNYLPQDLAGFTDTISLYVGDNYTIKLGFDDTVTTSTYDWYKDNVFINSTTTNQLNLTNVALADTGVYSCKITNSIAIGGHDCSGGDNTNDTTFTPFELFTRPITIQIQSCRYNDSLALVDFYHSTDGANWDSVAVWDLTEPLDSFYGVYLNENGCVDSLILNSVGLSGTLPDLNLPNLTYLLLRNCSFQDSIPDFSHLDKIKYLWLNVNSFKYVPDFSNMPTLLKLFLKNNNLQGSIPNFSNLPNLTDLNLTGNDFADTIPNFNSLQALVELSIRENNLIGAIPDFNLPNLELLWLSGNDLTSVPNFSNLPNLLQLYVHDNNLDSIPEFTSLPCIGRISICTNKLTFEDILPNMNKVSNACVSTWDATYKYTPQDSVGIEKEFTFYVGSTDTIKLGFDDTVSTSTYYWYRDGILIDSTTTNQLVLDNVSLADTGIYHCRVTNSIAVGSYPCLFSYESGANDTLDFELNVRPITIMINNCRESDSLALVELYNSADGINWTNPWDLNQGIDTWHGVYLNENGCVDSLTLHNAGLNGILPDLNLPNLTYLYLRNYIFQDSIPDFSYLNSIKELILHRTWNLNTFKYVPNFSKLPSTIEKLSLMNNNLEGTIPDFSHLPNLRILELSGNNFTAIPDFSHLDSLTSLFVWNNQLEGAIPDFSNLPNLGWLWIYGNNLTSVPNFSNLPKLQELFIHNNEIDSIPDFTNIPCIRHVRVCNNKLTFDDILPNMGKVSNTCAPTLWDIEYSFTPQDSLGIDSTITLNAGGTFKIYLGFDDTVTTSTYYWYKNDSLIDSTSINQFTLTNISNADEGEYRCRITNSLAKSSKTCLLSSHPNSDTIVNLELNVRPITLIVNNCRELDSLALIELYNATDGANWTNAWDTTQPIDTWYGVTVNSDGCVTNLTLADNNLDGTLPDLNLLNLTKLYLSNNLLSDTIPNFTNLDSLEYLYLVSNDLMGNIPNFSNLPKLKELFLGGNQLSDTIPNFTNLPLLEFLHLKTNNLGGNIPDFDSIPKLEYLYLQNNNLDGNIPNFSNLKKIKVFTAPNNDLTGTIPDFDSLPNLEILYVHGNKLDSCLSFNNLPNLQNLRLHDNQLTFDDILQNIGKAPTEHTYYLQDSVGISDTIYLTVGSSYTIDLAFDDTVTTSTYNWHKDNQSISTSASNKYVISSIQPSDAGIYNVAVTNSVATGLTLHTAPITLIACPDVNLGNDTIVCEGSTLILDGENPGSTYSWNTGATSQVITVNPTTDTTYIVAVTIGTCTISDTINITILPNPIIAPSVIGDTICVDSTTDIILLANSTGTAVTTYDWDGPIQLASTVNPNITISNVNSTKSGTYSLTANGANGCSTQVDFDINITDEPASPTLIASDYTICLGEQITLTGTNYNIATNGGNSYNWSETVNGGLPINDQSSTLVAIPIAAGVHTYTYSVTIDGCQSTDAMVTVFVEDAPTIAPTVTGGLICVDGTTDMQLFANSIGTPVVTYAWSGPLGFTSNAENPVISNITSANSGTYTLVATTANGCSTTAFIDINITDEPAAPTLTASDNTICLGDQITLTGTDYGVGVGGTIQYNWAGDAIVNPGLQSSTIQVTPITVGILTYTYSVKIDGCTSEVTSISINVESFPNITSITTNSDITCLDGTTDVLIDANVTGAASYSWTGPNGFSSTEQDPLIENATSADSGPYVLTATSANSGCISTQTFTLTITDQPQNPMLGVSDSMICLGESITLIGTNYNIATNGGNSYNWLVSSTNGGLPTNTQSSTIVVTPIAGGTYTYSYDVTKDGCISTIKSVIISVEEAPMISPYAVGDITCVYGTSNLNLFANSTGLDSVVSWSWIGPHNFSSILENPTLHNITAANSGDYILTATTANSCTTTDFVTVNITEQPTDPNLTANDYTICLGESVTLTGTSYPIDTSNGDAYNWSASAGGGGLPANTQSSTIVVTPTAGGTITYTYSVTIDGCISTTATATITVLPLPIVNAGLDTAISTISPPIILIGIPLNGSWSGSYIVQTGIYGTFYPSISGLGTFENYYSVSMGGCSNTDTVIVTVYEFLSDTIWDTTCQGQSYPFGGTTYTTSGIYQDTLKNAANLDSLVLLNLTVLPISDTTNLVITRCYGESYTLGNSTYTTTGIYYETFTNSIGCDSLVALDLTILPSNTTTENLSICQGGTHTVGDSTYSITGTYTNTLLSSSGCDSIITTNLTILDTFYTIIKDTICSGEMVIINNTPYMTTGVYIHHLQTYQGCDSTVILDLEVVPPYVTHITDTMCFGENYVVGSNIYGQSGHYIDTLKTNNGCDSVVDLTLVVLSPLAINLQKDDVICAGSNTGKIAISITGGLPPYQYAINNGTYTTDSIFTGLSSGNYAITVLDANDCTINTSIYISEPAPILTQMTTIEQVDCHGNQTGKAKITAFSSSNYTYTYFWGNGETTDTAFALSAGWQLVTVTNQHGCTTIDSIEIFQPSQLIIDSVSTISDTCSREVGCVEIYAVGGMLPYDYSINGLPLFDSSFCGLLAGNHIIKVTDDNNCQDSMGVTINSICDSCQLYTPIVTTGNFPYQYHCFAHDSAEVIITVGDGKPAYDGWSKYIFTIIKNGQTKIIENRVGEVRFYVKEGELWEVKVTDTFGCHLLALSDVFVANQSNCFNLCKIYPVEWAVSPQELVITSGKTVILEATGDFETIQWFEGDLLSSQNTRRTFEVTPNETTEYKVVATNSRGCVDTLLSIITVSDTIDIPEYYGMGEGDAFIIDNVDSYSNNRLVIYNVWKQVVLDVNGYNNSWTGENVPEGMYRYVFEPKPNSTENHIEQGWIILVKK